MKKIKIILLTILSVFIFSNFQCEEIFIMEEQELEYLSYGTSFGECLGYCVREIVISGGVVFTKSGWNEEGALPDSTCSMEFVMDPLPGYAEEIDLETFKSMEESIGCPDCADGGAEWIELGFGDEVKRVTFEYMNEPDELKNIIPLLRELMESFKDCR